MRYNVRLFSLKQRRQDSRGRIMRPEILAPAGSMDALKAAVHAGADAVYLGGNKFGARAYANNFDSTALIEAIEYAHLYGVKVYLTINTLFRNEEIMELKDYLEPLYETGLDAVIVQDFGVMDYVHTVFPDLPIHASTQMTITTAYAYEVLRDYGVTRIVPARELSLEEIASLKQFDTPPEVEVFVQGALCYCYSGQCLMSSMLGGRSGNRGRCAQTCRLPYTLHDEDGNVIETNGQYLLSPKDMCGLESIPDLIQAGVDSFKIEGRMKRPEYVAVCVRAYRSLLDAWYKGEFSDSLVRKYQAELAEVFNRGGFTKGYYKQRNGQNMMSVEYPGNVGVSIGTISTIQKNQVSVQLNTDVYKGDILLIKGQKDEITLTSNQNGKKGQRIVLNAPKTKQLHPRQQVNRISMYPLMQELAMLIESEPQILLMGDLSLITGKPASLQLTVEIKGQRISCEYHGDVVESAANKPLTEATVYDKVGKTGGTRYQFSMLNIQMSEDAFYPLKSLKDLRRNAISALENVILCQSKRRIFSHCNAEVNFDRNMTSELVESRNNTADELYDKRILEADNHYSNTKNTVMVSGVQQYETVCQYDCFDLVYIDMQFFTKDELEHILKMNNKVAVVLPPILRANMMSDIIDMIRFIQKNKADITLIARNIDELALLKQLNYIGPVVTDYSLYTLNDQAAAFIKKIFSNARLTLPVEMNDYQIRNLDYAEDECEMIVYGYQQLMVSAQCLQKTVKQCDKNSRHFLMKDRYLKNFSILSVCKYCYNLIYNGIPTVLYDVLDETLSKQVVKRLHFTVENVDETRAIIDAYLQKKVLDGEKTRGHYKRGVE